MLNIPPDVFEQIKSAICRPEGTFAFEYTSPDAFKRTSRSGILLQIHAGRHLFRLERTETGLLSFIHSSPGTGTRIASIDLNQLPEFEKAFLSFTWSPLETHFYCGPRVPGAYLGSAQGKVSSRQFRIGEDGSVIQIGDESIEVMELRTYQQGKPILVPTGIEAWRNTLKAIDILSTGKSDQGFIFESVTANLTLSILVTGLEAYAKKRFCELEMEGVKPDVIALFAAFASKSERASSILEKMVQEAAKNNTSVLGMIVESGRINFQSYDHLKRAYKTAYGIKLGQISISSQVLNDLQRFIEYRHRVVHVSPIIGIPNEGKVPPVEPVFANHALAEQAVKCFNEVITKLHASSLTLKRID